MGPAEPAEPACGAQAWAREFAEVSGSARAYPPLKRSPAYRLGWRSGRLSARQIPEGTRSLSVPRRSTRAPPRPSPPSKRPTLPCAAASPAARRRSRARRPLEVRRRRLSPRVPAGGSGGPQSRCEPARRDRVPRSQLRPGPGRAQPAGTGPYVERPFSRIPTDMSGSMRHRSGVQGLEHRKKRSPSIG